jgi:hypothetical protein
VELKDLVGQRTLSGVDFDSQQVESYDGMETAEVCRFRLDGEIYVAVEDPEDGYRSSMREIVLAPNDVMKNTFDPVPVFCVHKTSDDGDLCDLLEIRDAKTSKLILVVGTDDIDDYYPGFISYFTPENMSCNG